MSPVRSSDSGSGFTAADAEPDESGVRRRTPDLAGPWSSGPSSGVGSLTSGGSPRRRTNRWTANQKSVATFRNRGSCSAVGSGYRSCGRSACGNFTLSAFLEEFALEPSLKVAGERRGERLDPPFDGVPDDDIVPGVPNPGARDRSRCRRPRRSRRTAHARRRDSRAREVSVLRRGSRRDTRRLATLPRLAFRRTAARPPSPITLEEKGTQLPRQPHADCASASVIADSDDGSVSSTRGSTRRADLYELAGRSLMSHRRRWRSSASSTKAAGDPSFLARTTRVAGAGAPRSRSRAAHGGRPSGREPLTGVGTGQTWASRACPAPWSGAGKLQRRGRGHARVCRSYLYYQ